MMKIFTKKATVQAGTLECGDTFQTDTGNVFMVIDGAPYITDDVTAFNFKEVIVNLENGTIDFISKTTMVRPVKLIAREE